MRVRALCLLLAAAVVALACSGSTAAPTGPDAGAGCDSSIHGHCTFPQSIAGIGPSCVEYSGADAVPAECTFLSALIAGQPGAGPCSRSQYDEACVLGGSAPDAGACLGFETVWSGSSDWNPDAGIPGLPPCLLVVDLGGNTPRNRSRQSST
jgi:hypothetical protein